VTVTCTGHQDGYWVNLVSTLMATAHRIDTVGGDTSWNVDDFGAELARDQQVGATVEEFARWVAQAERSPTFGRTALHALAATAGLTVLDSTTETIADLASVDTPCGALGITVERGRVIGFAYKLIDAAQARWRAVNAPHLVAFVRAGAVFHKGKLLERPVDIRPHTSSTDPETSGSEVA